MSKSSKGFVHLILIIGVVLVGIVGVGYYVTKNGQVRLSSSNVTTNQFTPAPNTPTPTKTENSGLSKGSFCQKKFDCPLGECEARIDGKCSFYECVNGECEIYQTDSWKTYRNEEYGFELKYPPIEEIETNGKYITFGHQTITVSVDSKINFFYTKSDGTKINLPHNTLEEFVREYRFIESDKIQFPVEPYSVMSGEAFKVKNFELTLIDGFEMIRLHADKLPENTRTVFTIDEAYIKKSDEHFIHLTNDKSYDNKSSLLFDQILSTFKFIE